MTTNSNDNFTHSNVLHHTNSLACAPSSSSHTPLIKRQISENPNDFTITSIALKALNNAPKTENSSCPTGEEITEKNIETIDNNTNNVELGRDENNERKTSISTITQKVTFWEACFQCMKKSVAFSFSSALLVTLVAAYLLLGGIIFDKLESTHEEKVRQDILAERNRFAEEIWNMKLLATKEETFNRDNVAYFSQKLEHYERQLLEALEIGDPNLLPHSNGTFTNYTDEHLANGTELTQVLTPNAERNRWNLESAILYSTTVITTIGYGNMVPKTSAGRIVTMVYALFGIPLMIITLTHIGTLLANIFRFIYNHGCLVVIKGCLTCLCPCCHCQKKRKSRSKRRKPTTLVVIEINDKNGQQRDDQDSVNTDSCNDENKSSAQHPRHIQYSHFKKHSKESIPTLLILGVVMGYLMAVATVFKYWTNWDWLEAVYFCFITFSTIGFGDYVPGHDTYDTTNTYKTVVCALSVLFGLALVSMAFNLMLDNFKNTTRDFCSCCRKDEEMYTIQHTMKAQSLLTYKNKAIVKSERAEKPKRK